MISNLILLIQEKVFLVFLSPDSFTFGYWNSWGLALAVRTEARKAFNNSSFSVSSSITHFSSKYHCGFSSENDYWHLWSSCLFCSPSTSAIYPLTPNNPSGQAGAGMKVQDTGVSEPLPGPGSSAPSAISHLTQSWLTSAKCSGCGGPSVLTLPPDICDDYIIEIWLYYRKSRWSSWCRCV